MPDLRGSDWRARQCKGFVHSDLSGAVASRRFQARHIHQTEFLTRSLLILTAVRHEISILAGRQQQQSPNQRPSKFRAMQQSSLAKVFPIPSEQHRLLVPSPSRPTSEPPHPHPCRKPPDPEPGSMFNLRPWASQASCQAQWGPREKSGQLHPSLPIQDRHQVRTKEIAHLIPFWQK